MISGRMPDVDRVRSRQSSDGRWPRLARRRLIRPLLRRPVRMSSPEPPVRSTQPPCKQRKEEQQREPGPSPEIGEASGIASSAESGMPRLQLRASRPRVDAAASRHRWLLVASGESPRRLRLAASLRLVAAGSALGTPPPTDGFGWLLWLAGGHATHGWSRSPVAFSRPVRGAPRARSYLHNLPLSHSVSFQPPSPRVGIPPGATLAPSGPNSLHAV